LKINTLPNKFSLRPDQSSLLWTDEEGINECEIKKKNIHFHLFPSSGSNVEWSFCALHYRRPTCRLLLLAIFPVRSGVYILPLHVTAAKGRPSVFIATYVWVM